MSEDYPFTPPQAFRAVAVAAAVDLHNKRSDITNLLPPLADVLDTAAIIAEYVKTGVRPRIR